jgi:ClpP class serine protease
VISASFGFPRLLDRIGVERRVYTAGRSKAMLDPFQPEKHEDVARLQALQEEVHADFIDLVKARRGTALADDPELFSGAFWSGGRAVALGLADRVGELREVLKEKFGDDVVLKTVAAERSFWRRRLGFPGTGRLAVSLVDGLISLIEERLLWNRFGL